jgi:hypothetical protein
MKKIDVVQGGMVKVRMLDGKKNTYLAGMIVDIKPYVAEVLVANEIGGHTNMYIPYKDIKPLV